MASLIPNGTCGGCKAPIHWAKTVSPRGLEKPFPANCAPDPTRGNVTVDRGIAVVASRGQAEGMRAAGLDLYTSHFTTCPKADEFRKKASKGGKR